MTTKILAASDPITCEIGEAVSPEALGADPSIFESWQIPAGPPDAKGNTPLKLFEARRYVEPDRSVKVYFVRVA